MTKLGLSQEHKVDIALEKVTVIHHVKILNEKNYMIISIDAEKQFIHDKESVLVN